MEGFKQLKKKYLAVREKNHLSGVKSLAALRWMWVSLSKPLQPNKLSRCDWNESSELQERKVVHDQSYPNTAKIWECFQPKKSSSVMTLAGEITNDIPPKLQVMYNPVTQISDNSICVSKNRGTPKSFILIGCSIINHPFWGTPIFGNTYIIS